MKSKIMLTVILLSLVSCAQPKLYQKETGEMISQIIETQGNMKAMNSRIQASRQNQDQLFDRIMEWFVDFDGVKDWWNIFQVNSPRVKYIIFIINGTSGIEYEGGQMPIQIKEKIKK